MRGSDVETSISSGINLIFVSPHRALLEIHARCAGCSAGFHDGLGDVLRALESAANIDALSGGLHRLEGARVAELSFRKFYTQSVCKFKDLGGGLHSHGKDDHVETLFSNVSSFIRRKE